MGDGSNIKVWNDNWLPFQNGFKIITKDNVLNRDLVVRDLFAQDSCRWNKTLIDTFLTFEGDIIKQIPIINIHKKDELM